MLNRDGPIRSWVSAVGPDAPNATAAPPGGAETPVDGRDPIVRGVVSGGRVVDEWIRQAQQTARLLGGTGSNAGWADASGQMFRTASDLMAAWWSMLGVPLPNGGAGSAGSRPAANHDSAWQARTSEAAPGVPPTPQSAMNTAPPESRGPHVTFEVASRRPVEITVDLHKEGCTELQVLDLRPERGKGRRIGGTQLEALDRQGLRLRLTIPDNQAPGTYHAVVLDRVADCAVGTVTLRIRR
jgi:hypothetical protein